MSDSTACKQVGEQTCIDANFNGNLGLRHLGHELQDCNAVRRADHQGPLVLQCHLQVMTVQKKLIAHKRSGFGM